jgi:hypothetical protein
VNEQSSAVLEQKRQRTSGTSNSSERTAKIITKALETTSGKKWTVLQNSIQDALKEAEVRLKAKDTVGMGPVRCNEQLVMIAYRKPVTLGQRKGTRSIC